MNQLGENIKEHRWRRRACLVIPTRLADSHSTRISHRNALIRCNIFQGPATGSVKRWYRRSIAFIWMQKIGGEVAVQRPAHHPRRANRSGTRMICHQPTKSHRSCRHERRRVHGLVGPQHSSTGLGSLHKTASGKHQESSAHHPKMRPCWARRGRNCPHHPVPHPPPTIRTCSDTPPRSCGRPLAAPRGACATHQSHTNGLAR
jgi:hypothetical protein